MSNANYAYYQLTYYDVPQNDSITKVFAGFPSDIGGPDNNYLWDHNDSQYLAFGIQIVTYVQGVDDNDKLLQIEPQQSTMKIVVDMSGVTNQAEMGERLYDGLSKTSSDAYHTYDPLVLDERWLVASWFSRACNFYYDAQLLKYVWEMNQSYSLPVLQQIPASAGGGRITGQELHIVPWAQKPFPALSKQQVVLAAALVGGVTNADQSSFDAAFRFHFVFDYGLLQTNTEVSSWFPYALLPMTVHAHPERGFKVIGQQTPVLYGGDGYVYIRGGSETAFWNQDGTSSDVIEILPRNRIYGNVVETRQSCVMDLTNKVKTSLANIRSLKFYLTDSNGFVLQVDEPVGLKVAITFDIDT